MRQKGFTFLELLFGLAISGLLIVVTVSAFNQVVWGGARTSDQVVVLTDVHRATLQIKKDLEMTQNTNLTDGVPRESVNLTWTDFTSFDLEENKDHSSNYALSDGDLRRTYDGTTSIVGRNITSVDFTQNDRVINVVITATEGKASPQSETLEFSVYLRGVGIQ